MSFLDFMKLPNINDKSLDDAAERRAIKEYLFQLTKQLKYVLENLDEKNLSTGLAETVSGGAVASEKLASIAASYAAVSRELTSLRSSISEAAKKSEIIAAINATIETARILAEKIALEGYESNDGAFLVDQYGTPFISFGAVGSASVDGTGGIVGVGKTKLGGMALKGNTIKGLQISALNIGAFAGSGPFYVLVTDSTGAIMPAALTVVNSVPAYAAPSSPPSTFTSVNVVQIRMAGHGAAKRETASASGVTIGTCVVNEIYAYDSLVSGWAHCTTRYNYGSTGWTAEAVTAFYLDTTSGIDLSTISL